MAAQTVGTERGRTSSSSSPSKSVDEDTVKMKRRKSEHEQTSSGEGDDGSPTNEDDDDNDNDTPLKGSPPPLPDEPPPTSTPSIPRDGDDGWQPVWNEIHQAYYFFNRFSGLTTWTNPRIPTLTTTAPGVSPAPITTPVSRTSISVEEEEEDPDIPNEAHQPKRRPHGGYDPSIHGDYDPKADYAQPDPTLDDPTSTSIDPSAAAAYEATGTFNRFTKKWQSTAITPENFNDENKSRRQMNAFFDVDAAANSHDGKSLKAERSGKRLSRKEVKAFKDKRRSKKEEKRRAWLRD
ncbi:MAG: hypothetical protein M1823_000808 [Watsoniomyces obsoletus]|nr:MAG: hypothetical protein M1823_000808 [Watsoniomyces obsoletus]